MGAHECEDIVLDNHTYSKFHKNTNFQQNGNVKIITRSTEKQLMGQDKQIIWIDGLFGYIANWHIKLVKDFSSA